MHGFDGVAEVTTGATFVPDGISIWEFGTGENYERKASDDFKKRTDAMNAENRMHFVLGTKRAAYAQPKHFMLSTANCMPDPVAAVKPGRVNLGENFGRSTAPPELEIHAFARTKVRR